MVIGGSSIQEPGCAERLKAHQAGIHVIVHGGIATVLLTSIYNCDVMRTCCFMNPARQQGNKTMQVGTTKGGKEKRIIQVLKMQP